MRTDLQLSSRMDLGDLAKAVADSGYFGDSRKSQQAVVKILAGQELGIGPIQSMMGLFIVEGRVTVSASLASALLVRAGKYRYRIRKHTHEVCVLEFFEGEESLGLSEFTIEDAKRAGLVKDKSAWMKWPKNMLFARALTNGVRWYAPDALAGRVEIVSEEEIREVKAEVVSQESTSGGRLREIASRFSGVEEQADVDSMRRDIRKRFAEDEDALIAFFESFGEEYPQDIGEWTDEQVRVAHGVLTSAAESHADSA